MNVNLEVQFPTVFDNLLTVQVFLASHQTSSCLILVYVCSVDLSILTSTSVGTQSSPFSVKLHHTSNSEWGVPENKKKKLSPWGTCNRAFVYLSFFLKKKQQQKTSNYFSRNVNTVLLMGVKWLIKVPWTDFVGYPRIISVKFWCFRDVAWSNNIEDRHSTILKVLHCALCWNLRTT